MNYLSITLPLGVCVTALGSAIGLGLAVTSAMNAVARQPEAAGKIQMLLVIGCAFIEALTIYAVVVVFILQGKM
ncbi:MAG TPA: ATP synthase F0 subunit C [Candidatus Fermentibacter daniensis]|jgi:F-type H+-transporting ATPase subunit c|nr:MAG: hypothetical protein AO396_08635 [Candidatus Fermentibacter daniensis]MBP7720136.1 ATP synthase F0 subunit C [Candidatus Fermentibacter sp.]OQC68491.1 MAG: ATP synthase subunit c [candidate division Hyd24-12 bacterium ADurb.Bin004]KZD20191.1 MAG: hypothetical protein AO394_08620 [Candidatus Fermentibacter daniensis]MCC6871290.1 ATP synthase F0 subunit C [Candidatus Fermentibacter sp.]